MVTATADPADQSRRRIRARVRQQEIATRLNISATSVSHYENGRKPLPYELTAADYEAALSAAIAEREQAGAA